MDHLPRRSASLLAPLEIAIIELEYAAADFALMVAHGRASEREYLEVLLAKLHLARNALLSAGETLSLGERPALAPHDRQRLVS